MSSGRSDLIDIAGEIVHETERAVLFFDGTRKVWLPKAAVEIGDDGTVTMPERLALEKELI
jgi:RNase P/RNase MRP subunit p29